MKTIVLSLLTLALASAAFADEYTPVDGVQIIDEGKFGIRIGSLTNLGCLLASTVVLGTNDLELIVSSSKWQIRSDDGDSWADVPETTVEGVCGLANPTLPGEYRWVMDGEVNGVKGKYASANILIVSQEGEVTSRPAEEPAEEPETTAVEAVSWGFLKSKAAH